MRISDWSSDVCSSDLIADLPDPTGILVHQRRVRQRVGGIGVVEIALAIAAPDREFPEARQPLQIESMAVALVAQAIGVEQVERRSEEHTSELQSLMRISYAVLCLKKKTKRLKHIIYIHQSRH